MVKRPTKPNKNIINTINRISPEKKPQQKPRQQNNAENYQKNKAKKKAQQKERYLQKKQQEQEQSTKYYQATNIKILMSLKEYINLNKATKKP